MISIQGRAVGLDAPPLIIAELSGNHGGSIDTALELIAAAAEAGADAVKLQTYTADTMTLNIDDDGFRVTDPTSPWANSTLYELYGRASTPWEWHGRLFERARELGLIAFSTPFDATAVDLLEELNVPCYKIASFENVDIPLIQRVAATGKPLIISTGMASLAEIDEAVSAARGAGCSELVLLKCTSTYPAPPEHTNLATIPALRAAFDCEVGLSDHTLGIGVAVASVALGAVVIEKHLTLRRSDGMVDGSFSLEPHELRELVVESRRAHQAVGRVTFGPTDADRVSLKYRRSLYLVNDVAAGEVLGEDDVRAIRPGFGLSPRFRQVVVGRTLARSVKRGTPVSWDLF